MAWNLEQAANDLERYLIRREPPADGAVEVAISRLRQQERTCKVTPSKNLQGIVVCECGEPFPEYYDYCPYCGAKVINQ